MSAKDLSKLYTTPTVDQISAANIYIDPAVWSRVIVHPGNKKPNWLAIHLLARILYWYTRTEVRDEVTGKFIGYKKKFKYDKLQMSYQSIMEQMGCTYKEARLALDCLVAANVIGKEIRNLQWQGNVMFIEPIPENILCIIHPEGVHKDTTMPLEGQTLCTPGHRPSAPGGTESTLTTTLCSSLITTKEHLEDGQSVDNSEQLSTRLPPPKNRNLKKGRREEQLANQKENDRRRVLGQQLNYLVKKIKVK